MNTSTTPIITTALNFSDVQVDNNKTGAFSMMNTVHPQPGNRIFARMVNKNREVFQSIKDMKHKKLLVLSMVMAVQNNGGRFVQKKGCGEWIVLTNKEAFARTVQALKCDGVPPLRPSLLMNRKSRSVFAAAKRKITNASSNSKKSSCSPVAAVNSIAKCFANKGIDVILDADGSKRHHSKRAHQDRIANKDRLRVQLLDHRASLAHLTNHPNPTLQIIAQKESLMASIRKKESQRDRSLPPTFLQEVKDCADQFRSTTSASISFKSSLWQADPAIAKRAIDGEIEAILSGDSDFAMYVGTDAPDHFGDIMFRKPNLNKRDNKIDDIEIWTGQKSVVQYINSILENRIDTSPFGKEPRYPIFDGMTSLRARTLFAIALGCDALPGGIVGFAGKKASAIKSSTDWEQDSDAVEESLLLKLVDESSGSKPKRFSHVPAGLSRDDFICLSNSIMYEATHGG